MTLFQNLTLCKHTKFGLFITFAIFNFANLEFVIHDRQEFHLWQDSSNLKKCLLFEM